jgi:hypothetical protein
MVTFDLKRQPYKGILRYHEQQSIETFFIE